MKWKQLSECGEVFQVIDIFSDTYYPEVLDEFNFDYNHIRWSKTEKRGQPIFGEHVDQGDHRNQEFTPFNHGIGWNFKFMESSFYAKHAAQKILKRDLHLIRINTNYQFFGMDGDWHVDYINKEGSAWSFVIYINDKWDYTWDGQFVVTTKNRKYLNVNPVPNSGCLFNAKLEHRGGAPNRFCMDCRTSLAFVFEE